jgi:hypothetical protein
MFDFLRALDQMPIRLVPERSVVTPEMLREEVGEGPLVACDFHVVDIELGERVPGGFARAGILNVDHHAPVREMERHISSTNLAIEMVRASGPAPVGTEVVLHHTDCDSVLSGAIARGVMPPDDRYGAAAISADHTGVEDDIADLLQAMQGARDLHASLAALSRLLHGAPLPERAREALSHRRRERDAARHLVLSGQLKIQDGLAWARYDRGLDTALLPSLLPDATLIMIARRTRTGRWINKLRLGLAAPPGASLHRLGLHEFDPGFGGRWNAGSNRRSGGTKVSPNWYVRELRARMGRMAE